MELQYKNSFFRDLDNLANRALKREIEKIIEITKSAHSIHYIPRMKPLRTRMRGYKIELRVYTKIYWILSEILYDKIIFTRIKSEVWCKKNL